MRHTLPAILFSLLVTSPSAAQIGTFDGPPNSYSSWNTIWPLLETPSSLYINVMGTWKGARFAAPLPSCSGIAITHVEVLNGYTATGDLETGIEVQFGTCLPPQTDESHAVIRIDFVSAPGLVHCCPFPVLPHPGFGQIQLIDCDDTVVTPSWTAAVHFTGTGYDGDCGQQFATPPRDPFPPDGATGVPLSFSLIWYRDGFLGENYTFFEDNDVYFGTDPDPPLSAIELPYWPVGPLEPNTTYYWRVAGTDNLNPFAGPLWSFTTTAPVRTEASTWGRIKALYRK